MRINILVQPKTHLILNLFFALVCSLLLFSFFNTTYAAVGAGTVNADPNRPVGGGGYQPGGGYTPEPIYNPGGTPDSGDGSTPPPDPGSGPSSSPTDIRALFIELIRDMSFPTALPADGTGGRGLQALNTFLQATVSAGRHPSEMGGYMKSPGRMNLRGIEPALLHDAKRNLEALIRAVNKMDEDALNGAKTQFAAAFELINAYGGLGGTGTGTGTATGSGTGTGAGTGTGTGGGGGGGACDGGATLPANWSWGGNITAASLRAGNGNILLPGFTVSGSQTIAVSENPNGPLVIQVKYVKNILTEICGAIKEVNENVKALKDDIRRIRVATESIDVTTKAIKVDTGDLVRKEYELDPKAWKDAKKGIDAEATTFAKYIASGRGPNKTTVEYSDPDDPSKVTVAESAGLTFTPDINQYEDEARINAANDFYKKLLKYFETPANYSAAFNAEIDEKKGKLKDFILNKFYARVSDEAQTDLLKIERVTDYNDPYNAYLYLNAVYNQKIEQAGKNAVSEYVAGNTIIGNKECSVELVDIPISKRSVPDIDPTTGEPRMETKTIRGIKRYEGSLLETLGGHRPGDMVLNADGTPVYETTEILVPKTKEIVDKVEKFCPDYLKVVTSAPVIKSLLEQFNTTKLRQAELADERGEDANVSGIVAAAISGCPSGQRNSDGSCKPTTSSGTDSGTDTGTDTGGTRSCSALEISDPSSPTGCSPRPVCPGDGIFNPVTRLCPDGSSGVLPPCGPGQTRNPVSKQCTANQTQASCGVGKIVDPANPLACIDRPTCPGGEMWSLAEPHCPTTTPPAGRPTSCPSGQIKDTNNQCVDETLYENCLLGDQSACDQLPTGRGAHVPSGQKYSNLASVASLKSKTLLQNLNLTSESNVLGGIKKSILTFSLGGASACLATSDWPTFVKPIIDGVNEPSLIFKNGEAIPANQGTQTFEVVHPRVFDIEISIARPAGLYVISRQPLPQKNISSSISNRESGLLQRTAYTPDLTNVQAGDKLTLKIDNAELSIDILNIDQPDVVNRIVMEATQGNLTTRKAFSEYSFKQNGKILIVSNKTPRQNSIPKSATYSLECNINNKVVPKSINITFP